MVVDHVIYGSSICLAWFMCAVYMSELQAVFLLASLLMENIYPLQFTDLYLRQLSISRLLLQVEGDTVSLENLAQPQSFGLHELIDQ